MTVLHVLIGIIMGYMGQICPMDRQRVGAGIP